MIVDSHCHVGGNWYEPVETLLHHMDRNGVAQAVLIQPLGQYHNAYQEDSRRAHPERLASVVGLDPTSPDAIAELRRLVDQGACGLRLRPNARSPGPDPLAIWRAAADYGIAVSCVGTSALFAAPDFTTLVTTLPRLSIVLEHLGGSSRPDENDNERADRARAFELARYPNVYLKLPGLGELVPRAKVLSGKEPPWEAGVPAVVIDALENFGTARLMWGSDFPVVSSREGYANALQWTADAIEGVNPAAKELIFGKTAKRVFRLA